MGISRRNFLLSVPALAVASMLPSCKATNSEQENTLNRFIKDISRYDIVHFGEIHPKEDTEEASTLEDFVDIFLPRLRDERIVERKFDVIRCEHLPLDFDTSLEGNIPIEDLDFLKERRTTLEAELLSYKWISRHADPVGAKKLAIEGVTKGYQIKGIFPDKKGREDLDRDVIKEWESALRETRDSEITYEQAESRKMLAPNIYGHTDPDILVRIELERLNHDAREYRLSTHAIQASIEGIFEDFYLLKNIMNLNDNYIGAATEEMEKDKKIILYGGTAHNDTKQGKMMGIGSELEEMFPGRYVRIDIVKPSIIDRGKMERYNPFYRDLERNHLGQTDSRGITIMRTPGLSIADYVVILPKKHEVKVFTR